MALFRAGRVAVAVLVVCVAPFSMAQTAGGAALPFDSRVEVYRDEDGDVLAFALRLEQPFLAEEFETSSDLRLTSLDGRSLLVYPKVTTFHQRHAEFFGRLRGEGTARLSLSYETVSEGPDGARVVDVRSAEVAIELPGSETGPESIHRRWAEEQNAHFARLLRYYPEESFYEYVLLQSRDRYGVVAPSLARPSRPSDELETSLYHTFSAGLSLQNSLQRATLDGSTRRRDYDIHVSSIAPPGVTSLDYAALLESQRELGREPAPHDVARLVPDDQYFLHFRSMGPADTWLDIWRRQGEALLRLVTSTAREHHLEQKLEEQLAISRSDLAGLFDAGTIGELAVTGSDFFLAEGADITLVFRVDDRAAFDAAQVRWLSGTRARHADLEEREFNYRGFRVDARYTGDRVVSSFVISDDGYTVVSNSHRAIRRIIDCWTDKRSRLHEALDYLYLTTLLPPSTDRATGYAYLPDRFLRRSTSPEVKISEKRRLECFNNLVMLNNASLFHRLEYRASPGSLTDLIEGRFIDPAKLVCPHGGTYGWDAERDTCTCSLHNRLRYLTPNVELGVLEVSSDERREYERYKTRYGSEWQGWFAPVAARLSGGQRARLELAVPPFADRSRFDGAKRMFEDAPRSLSTADIAASAFASIVAVPGRERLAGFLRSVPGVEAALAADPTLTDLTWLGDEISLHYADDETIVNVDPLLLRPLETFFSATVFQQMLVAAGFTALTLPVYATVEVEDEAKAERLLELLPSRIFLEGSDGPFPTRFDAYRAADHAGTAIHVLTFQVYALEARVYVALHGGRLILSTRESTLHDAIDARSRRPAEDGEPAHALLRWNRTALDRFRTSLERHWAEASRRACHRNAVSILNLVSLYDVPAAEVDALSSAKYGVTWFCPDGGEYRLDADRQQVVCSLHGNREEPRQLPAGEGESAFARFLSQAREVTCRLRFADDALFATLEIDRATE